MKNRAGFLLTLLCAIVVLTTEAQTFAVSGSPLEIARLKYFTGINKDNNISLTWSTSGEQSSSHFVIENSSDGLRFDSIGAVTAVGRFQLSTIYRFEDQASRKGIQYYRLKIIGLDGSEEQGKILKVTSARQRNTEL